ncbi:MAG: hypothetical protein ACOC2B_03925 [Sediminispirochaetaceae bacterium]
MKKLSLLFIIPLLFSFISLGCEPGEVEEPPAEEPPAEEETIE